MTTVGTHLLAEYRGIDAALLDDATGLEAILVEAAHAAGARVLDQRFHRFDGGGVSGFLLLAESHVSIHTWPSERRAAVDVYTCGDARPDRAHEVFLARLAPSTVEVVTLRRGARIERLP
ncbi:MAG: adenosylmethionine decarboxylase [Sandaracinus sp.]